MAEKPTYEDLERMVSELQKAEQEVREARKEWEEIFQAIGQPALILDSDHNILKVNRATIRETGSSEEELLKKKCFHIFHNTLFPPHDCPLETLLLSGRMETVEIELETLGKTFLVACTPVLDEQGQIKKIIHIATDIFEIKKAETDLKDSEEKFRVIFDGAFDGLLIADVESKMFSLGNPSICRMLGYTAEEIKHVGLSDIHPPEALPYVIDQFERQARKEIGVARNLPVRTKEGKLFYADISSSPIFLNGRTCLLGIFRDVTERKGVEDGLQKEKEKFQLLVEGSPFGVALIDKKGRYLYINPKFEDIFGYTLEDIPSGRVWFQKAFPDQTIRKKVMAAWINDQNQFKSGAFRTRTVHVHCKDGSFKWIHIQSVSLKDGTQLITFDDITERKQREEALRISEEKFSKAFKTSPDSIAINRLSDGVYLEINEGFTKNTGYTREDVIGRSSLPGDLDIWVHPNDRERMVASLQATGEMIGLEAPFRCKDGRVTYGRMSARVLEIEGEPCLLSITNNITERKQSEDELKRKESLNFALFEYNPIQTIVVDLEGRIINFNQAKKISGDRQPNIGDIMYRSYAGNHEIDMHNELMECLTTGKLKEFPEMKYRNKFLSITMAPFSMGAIIVSEDITERKRVEEATQIEKERFQLLVEGSPFGVALIDPTDCYQYINTKFEEIFGYTLEDIPSRRDWFTQAYPDPEIRQEVIDNWGKDRKMAKPGEFSQHVFKIRCKNNSDKWIDVKTVSFVDGTFLIFYEDITKRKRHEEEKEKLERQFQQAQKMEAVGTLAGGIAHDFNNLLMGIQGRASLMLSDLDESQAFYEQLKEIETYVKSATDLTKQLLGLARRGKFEVQLSDINKIVDRSATLFGRTKKEISLHRKFQPDLWTVEVDRRQIEQVLLNLFVNAWQAMPTGGDLYLETRNSFLEEEYVRPFNLKPGKYVKISVTDTGTGMDETIIRKIFDPFFTTKEMARGTGLGLSSAYGIIKNHQGMINVYSEKGHGSTFNIYLPASEEELPVEPEPSPTIETGSETILLVDDEEMILKVGRSMLERLGHQVLTAKGGADALRILDEGGSEIGLVILDMIMPGMSGEETFQQIKAGRPEIKVLLSSGYSLNGHAQEILNKGCDGFIQKPFSLGELSEKIKTIMRDSAKHSMGDGKD